MSTGASTHEVPEAAVGHTSACSWVSCALYSSSSRVDSRLTDGIMRPSHPSSRSCCSQRQAVLRSRVKVHHLVSDAEQRPRSEGRQCSGAA